LVVACWFIHQPSSISHLTFGQFGDDWPALHCAPKLREKVNITIFKNLFINFLIQTKMMNKKELKFYETPTCEVEEMDLQGILCASPTGGGSADIDPEDIDPGFGD
jgi:hypothetical protein